VRIACRDIYEVPDSAEGNLGLNIFDFFYELEEPEHVKREAQKSVVGVPGNENLPSAKKLKTDGGCLTSGTSNKMETHLLILREKIVKGCTLLAYHSNLLQRFLSQPQEKLIFPKKLAPKTWFIPLNNSMKVRKTTKPSLLQPINLSRCGLHTRSSERSFCHYLCTPSASAELERERNRDRKERSCRQREKGERVGVGAAFTLPAVNRRLPVIFTVTVT